jgi:hypothetical protein
MGAIIDGLAASAGGTGNGTGGTGGTTDVAAYSLRTSCMIT